MLTVKRITNRLFITKLSSIQSISRHKCSVGVNHIYRWNDILFMSNINETIGSRFESATDKSQSVCLFIMFYV